MTEPVPRNYLDWSIRGKASIWRYILALVLAAAAAMGGGRIMVFLLRPLVSEAAFDTVIVEASFLPALVALPFIVRYVLGRPWYSFALPAWPGHWRDYFCAILVTWVVSFLMLSLLLFEDPSRISYRGFSAYDAEVLWLLVPMLLAFAVQTAAEEAFFRGLLMQFLRRLTRLIPVILLVQALVFALPHIGNVKSFGGSPLALLPYLIPALVMGWLAWRTGSLLVPAGLHMGSNTFVTLFTTSQADLIQTAAPIVITSTPLGGTILYSIVKAAVVVLVMELLIRKGVIASPPRE